MRGICIPFLVIFLYPGILLPADTGKPTVCPHQLKTEKKRKGVDSIFRIIVKYTDPTVQGEPLVGRIKYGIEMPSKETAQIFNLKVSKRYRGCGYGSYILREAMKDLQHLGFSRVTLGVLPKTPALTDRLKTFYQRHGFQKTQWPEMEADLTTIKK